MLVIENRHDCYVVKISKREYTKFRNWEADNYSIKSERMDYLDSIDALFKCRQVWNIPAGVTVIPTDSLKSIQYVTLKDRAAWKESSETQYIMSKRIEVPMFRIMVDYGDRYLFAGYSEEAHILLYYRAKEI